MAKTFQFYGKEIIDPGVYSKIVTVGGALPTPDGANALVIIAEAISGVEFGTLVTGTTLSDFKKILGDEGPAIEAVFKAQNASPSLSPAQDIRVFNPRALVQSTGTIETTSGGDDAITVKSRIYGAPGNSVNVVLASTLCTVSFPWSEDNLEQTIDNPIMDIIMPSGFVTITGTTIAVGLTGALTVFTFTDYPKLVDLITAIESAVPAATITKDVNTSDNQSTSGLFDQLSGENAITALTTLKGDLKQLFDFLDAGVPDIEATLLATATTAVDDFDLTLTGGTSGIDPDATQWGLVYDQSQTLAVTCPIADGIPTPYDETLTKAVMSLDEQHSVSMNQPDKRGKKRTSFISAHGGYGWNGQFVARPADADAVAALGNLHNSDHSQFFSDGVNAISQKGIEYGQLPCYFAVQCASMFVGGLASRVLTSQPVTAIKATIKYDFDDRKKIHKASVIIPITDGVTTIRQFYTSWKSTSEPMKTVPSRIRCVDLSSNDIDRKLEEWMKGFQADGISPQNAQGKTFIKRVLESHQKKTINWVESFGEITFSSSGIEFEYNVADHVVPRIPEYGFGTVESLNV